MLPITDFLSYTDPLDGFNSLSYNQTKYERNLFYFCESLTFYAE